MSMSLGVFRSLEDCINANIILIKIFFSVHEETNPSLFKRKLSFNSLFILFLQTAFPYCFFTAVPILIPAAGGFCSIIYNALIFLSEENKISPSLKIFSKSFLLFIRSYLESPNLFLEFSISAFNKTLGTIFHRLR